MGDILEDLKFIGFTARIKRLSERLMLEAKSIYEVSPLDIEPNWHLIFLLLEREKQLSVTEMADILGFSHPAIIKITRKMVQKGYLVLQAHPTDSRKKLLELSVKSEKILPEFKKEWAVIKSVITEVVDQDFLDGLSKIEQNMRKKRLLERYIEKREQ